MSSHSSKPNNLKHNLLIPIVMKEYSFLPLLFTIILLAISFNVNAEPINVEGIVRSTDGNNIEYCFITLTDTQDSSLTTGTISNSAGEFAMTIDKGEYIMEVSMLGYTTYQKVLSLTKNTDLGILTLSPSSIDIEEIIVRGKTIEHNATGYTLELSNNPVTIGRNVLQIFDHIPGMLFDREKGIAIYGKYGTRIMINDRMLNLTGEELYTYLETIPAENIKKIEVINSAGAKYDASYQGGIIKITLKKQNRNGFKGNIGFSYTQTDSLPPAILSPNFNFEYKTGKFNLYTGFNYTHKNTWETIDETTQYEINDKTNRSLTAVNDRYNDYNAKLGADYDINDKNKAGLEFNFSHNKDKSTIPSNGELFENGNISSYDKNRQNTEAMDKRFILSATYRALLDTAGSYLSGEFYFHRIRYSEHGTTQYDTFPFGTNVPFSKKEFNQTGRNDSLYSVNADYSQYINKIFKMEAGMKYRYETRENDIRYFDKTDNGWTPNKELSDHYLYREGILAGYINASASFSRFQLSAGLRTEYTALRPISYTEKEESRSQYYTDFFPSASLRYIIDKEKGYSISASYSRNIQRPGFNMLNPVRYVINNNTYLVGNPDLQPSYYSNYTLTSVFASKYSVTLGITDNKESFNQMIIPDPQNPEITLYKNVNVERITSYYLSASIPVTVTKWWTANFNYYIGYQKNKMPGYESNQFPQNIRLNNSFTLPKEWYIEFNASYISGAGAPKLTLKPTGQIDGSIKKVLAQKKLTLSLFISDIFGLYKQDITFYGAGMLKKVIYKNLNTGRYFNFSILYNFQGGQNSRK